MGDRAFWHGSKAGTRPKRGKARRAFRYYIQQLPLDAKLLGSLIIQPEHVGRIGTDQKRRGLRPDADPVVIRLHHRVAGRRTFVGYRLTGRALEYGMKADPGGPGGKTGRTRQPHRGADAGAYTFVRDPRRQTAQFDHLAHPNARSHVAAGAVEDDHMVVAGNARIRLQDLAQRGIVVQLDSTIDENAVSDEIGSGRLSDLLYVDRGGVRGGRHQHQTACRGQCLPDHDPVSGLLSNGAWAPRVLVRLFYLSFTAAGGWPAPARSQRTST
jgi:hypothetical protein